MYPSGLSALRRPLAAVGLAALLGPLAAAASAQQPKPAGAEVWSANCSRCHRLRAIDAYNAPQWNAIVTQMGLYARLTPDETDAVREFLVGAATAREAAASSAGTPERSAVVLASAAAEPWVPSAWCCDAELGKAIFDAQCRVCHGSQGKGDGPAAAGLNPKPPSLADATRLARLPDDSLLKVITQGRGTMPGFGKILTGEQLREVASYVRAMSKGH